MTPVTSFGPNWFAMVMGTGILALVAEGLPGELPGRHDLALVLWLLAAGLLAAVTVAGLRAIRRRPGLLGDQLADPVLGHFYGAPAMALLTVGAGTLLTGPRLLGLPAAVAVDALLWTVGTGLGLWTAVWVPFTAITRHRYADHDPGGTWLLPVVPPLVSAATGALLVPHLAGRHAQETLLLFCYACVGVTLLAAVAVFAQLWGHLYRHGPGQDAAVPALWIPLGFLGQSVTAVHHLGAVAPDVLPEYGDAFRMLTLVYGVPVWGFALLWLALAVSLTADAARRGLSFSLSWWSFTFPLGTVVTATSALASTTGLPALTALALALGLALAGIWAVVAVGTVDLLVRAPRARLAQAD